jgi:hypothetical protein
LSKPRDLSKLFSANTNVATDAELVSAVNSASAYALSEANDYTDNELSSIDLTSTINTASAAAFASASVYTDSAIASFEALPSQLGNAGKYLSTSGSVTSWEELDLNAAINTASAAAVNYSDNTFLPKTGGLISGDLELEGNLTISGSTSYINSTDLQINDPLIYLAVSPSNVYSSDILDVGFTAAYGPHPSGASAHYHRGLVFDITDDKWKLFSNAPHPVDNYIDFTSANYDTLKAGTFEGNIDVSNIIGLSATYYTKEEAEKSLLRWSKVYSGSATTIEGLDTYANPLEYTPSYINLYINGILQDPSNYTASSGSTVVLDQAVVNDDVVEILSYNTYTVVNDSYTRAESDNKYLSVTSSSNYLTTSDAASTYVTQSDATATYLTKSNATSTYLTQSSASSTYLTQSSASSNYSPRLIVENVQSSNYTLSLSDINKVISMNNSNSASVTIPTNSTVEFPIGTVINVYRQGTASVVIQGSGVTIRNSGSMNDQYAEISLRKRDTNEWVLVGNVQ